MPFVMSITDRLSEVWPVLGSEFINLIIGSDQTESHDELKGQNSYSNSRPKNKPPLSNLSTGVLDSSSQEFLND